MLKVFNETIFTQPDNSKCLVLDVGSNDGQYTIISAIEGCNVFAFEIQEGCISSLSTTIVKNKFQGRVRIIQQPVSSHRHDLELSFPSKCMFRYFISYSSLLS